MATNKHALIRYQILDKCFRNPGRKFFIEDLIACCNEGLQEHYGENSGISRRQIFKDIRDMEDQYQVPLKRYRQEKRIYYRYTDLRFSIANKPLSAQEESEMKEALITMSRIKGLPHFEWMEEMITRLDAGLNKSEKTKPIIHFDQNVDVEGLKHMQEIYHAITRETNLVITYKSFRMTEPKDFVLSPYFLKQYKGRWYLFGMDLGSGKLHNFPLDRMIQVVPDYSRFLPGEINFDDYFEDVIGVSKDNEPETLKIKIRVDARYYPYIATEPLHGSQKVLSRESESVVIQIEVVQNYELQSLLLSYGDLLEVLEPTGLRNTLAERIQKMSSRYESKTIMQ